MNKALKLFTVIAMLLASIAVATTASAHEGPELTPASVDTMILPGQSVDIEKTVHTSEIPPNPEIYFLVDTTGSMTSVIDQVKTDINAIIGDVQATEPSATFGLGQYKDFPFDPFAYQHEVSIGGDVPTAVAGLSASGGADGSEGQFFALDDIAKNNTPGFTFGADTTPIIVWIGDAPAHDPVCSAISGLGYDITEATVTADLVALGLTTVAVSTTTGFVSGLDDDPTLSASNYAATCTIDGSAGQATRITNATGGTHLLDVDPDLVADAIIDVLSAIQIEVSMASDCAAASGGVIDTTFAPATQTVESGEHAVFTETISVAADAPGGIYTCNDWALIDGEPMTDDTGATILESKRILVPENFVTGGGHVTEGKGKDRTSVLTFGGNAGYMADGTLDGQWQFNFHEADVKIHTTEITALQFSDAAGVEPAPPESDADTALMEATARAQIGNDPWLEGCSLLAWFQDGGEPQQDAVLSVDLDCGSTAFAADDLTGGNIQVHDGTKD